MFQKIGKFEIECLMNTNVRLMHVLVLENCKIIFLGRKCHLPYDVSVLPSMRLERDWEVNYPSKWSHFCWCSFSSSINSIDKPFRENERWKPDAQITLAFFAFLPWFYRVFTNITLSCVQNLLGHPVNDWSATLVVGEVGIPRQRESLCLAGKSADSNFCI